MEQLEPRTGATNLTRLAPSLSFNLVAHRIKGHRLWQNIDATPLLWVVGFCNFNHLLDPAQQSTGVRESAGGTILRLSPVGPMPHKDLIIPSSLPTVGWPCSADRQWTQYFPSSVEQWGLSSHLRQGAAI